MQFRFRRCKGHLVGFGSTDTILFLVDITCATTSLTTAQGTVVPSETGLATVTGDGDQTATVVVPQTPAPTTLIVQPLIKGTGAVLEAGDNIKVNRSGGAVREREGVRRLARLRLIA